MNPIQLFYAHSRCSLHKTLHSVSYFSNLYVPFVNDIIKKCCETKGKWAELHGCVYVINPEVANSIASCVAKEWNGGYLFESNAGPGILSNSLLQNGICHLRVFEKNKEFLSALEVLSVNYPCLEIVQQDLMMLPSLEFRKKLESSCQSNYISGYFNSIFKNMHIYSWERDTSFQVFSIIANKKSHKFLRYLLAALPNKATIFSFGRCDFFLLITEREFKCMKALPKENFSMYRWSTVLYNLFFEIKFLQKFSTDSENFLFCTQRDKKKERSRYLYLIKLTPKPDIFLHPMTPEKMADFIFFVRSNLAKRSDLVIKSIEKWMPFCGPRLIKEGLNVFVKFGDLSPQEILWLFNYLTSWSEYQNCYSQASASKFSRKKNIDDDNLI